MCRPRLLAAGDSCCQKVLQRFSGSIQGDGEVIRVEVLQSDIYDEIENNKFYTIKDYFSLLMICETFYTVLRQMLFAAVKLKYLILWYYGVFWQTKVSSEVYKSLFSINLFPDHVFALAVKSYERRSWKMESKRYNYFSWYTYTYTRSQFWEAEGKKLLDYRP